MVVVVVVVMMMSEQWSLFHNNNYFIIIIIYTRDYQSMNLEALNTIVTAKTLIGIKSLDVHVKLAIHLANLLNAISSHYLVDDTYWQLTATGLKTIEKKLNYILFVQQSWKQLHCIQQSCLVDGQRPRN